MFGIDFSELIVIGIVALVVVGPERLPKVARTAGLLLGRMQRYVNSVKADISREMQLDELKKLQSDIQESARNFERSITSEIKAVEQDVGQAAESLKAEFEDASASVRAELSSPAQPGTETVAVAGEAEAPVAAKAGADAADERAGEAVSLPPPLPKG